MDIRSRATTIPMRIGSTIGVGFRSYPHPIPGSPAIRRRRSSALSALLRVPTPVEPAFTRIGGKKGRICTRPLELGSGGCLQGKTSAPCPIKANKTLKYLLGSNRSAQAPVTAKIRGRSANQKGAVLRHCVDSEPIDDRTSVTSWCWAFPQPEIESWALCEKNGKKKAKQRAHAEKRRAQDQATVGASEHRNISGSQRPAMGRAV